MKFSIATPSFNQGRFIADCIESVAAQNYPHEHLIFDACSTDETLEVLKRHVETPGLQWVSEPDKGQCDGINKGFRAATGDWVMWLNGDDFLLPGALAKVAAFIEAHPEADVVYGGWQFTDAQKHVTKTIRVFPFDLGMMIHYGSYIASTACFYRKKTVIDEGYLLNLDFHFNMDGEFYSRLGKAGKRFLYLPEILAGFRVHEQNISFRYKNIEGMKGILRRQLALAEAMAIRRAYGITPFSNPMANAVSDAVLWYYYRAKKVALKLIHGSY